MTDHFICKFDDPQASDVLLVGGKGANLGLLTKAGFPVPGGFSVTTAAYSGFLAATGLTDKISAILAGANYDDLDTLEAVTSDIRSLITEATMPAVIASQIDAAYQELGGDTYVAVRSSGTAEDLAEASFAGLHDTFLDVKGTPELVDAVKQCWASLWTARATGYRQRNDFSQGQAEIAVVVQTMIESAVSGVMFTGNPMTTATDEIVIDASWGLGEAVVQGIVVPDNFVVKSGTLTVIERTLGSKDKRIVRDRQRGSGTVIEETPEPERRKFSLADGEVAELAELGRRVTAYYQGFPQDTEWGFADGKFYLLQSRPITGVEFSWDADLDGWQTDDEDDETVWSRTLADQIWTGAVTPLFYSIRGLTFTSFYHEMGKRLGIKEMVPLRVVKFHKGEAYFNPESEMLYQQRTWVPALREPDGGGLWLIPPTRHDEVLEAPFSYRAFIRSHLRILAAWPEHNMLTWFKVMDDWVATEEWDLEYLPNPCHLSDSELKRTIDKYHGYEIAYNDDAAVPFLTFTRDSLGVLKLMIEKWYDGENPMAYAELLTGATRRTKTVEENLELYLLSEEIRQSETLHSTFRSNLNGEFFRALEGTDEGERFLSKYRDFVKRHGHRGNEDRDIYYPRRAEDPSIDYRALGAFLSLSPDEADPRPRELETNRRRQEVLDDVLRNLQMKPLGFLKAEALKQAYNYVHRWILIRDDERWSYERFIFGMKLLLKEMARRLVERELIVTERDIYFLSKDELFTLFDGHAEPNLTRAKISARMRDFDRVLTRQRKPAMYLRRGREVVLDSSEGSGSLRGTGTSPGTVTATARVVERLSEVHRVNAGEILVCNATDPGWTPVFQVISGIVTETGSLLAHASCLSREYGLPCVTQLHDAMTLIPDGATITINGSTGEVVVEETRGVTDDPAAVEHITGVTEGVA